MDYDVEWRAGDRHVHEELLRYADGCRYAHRRADTHTHTCTHTHTHTHTRAHPRAHAHARTHTRARERTHTRARAHARTHRYRQAEALALVLQECTPAFAVEGARDEIAGDEEEKCLCLTSLNIS